VDFLKLFNTIRFIVAFTLLATNAHAELTEGEAEITGGAGPGNLSLLGFGGQLKFDSGEAHFNLTKQFSPEDPTNINSSIKHTNNWTGGIGQAFTEKFSVGLDYDRLSDDDENLSTDGGKVTVTYDPYHLSYRYARDRIDQNFNVGSRVYSGAFVYQETIEAGAEFDLDKRNTLSPSISYSIFAPNVQAFADVLGKSFAASLSNFTDTLQSFEQWAVSLNYDHKMTDRWSYAITTTVSHLVIGNNPSIELTTVLTRKWSPHFSTDLGVDYNYIPGEPTWTVNLALKFKMGDDEKEKPDQSKINGKTGPTHDADIEGDDDEDE